MRSFAKPFFFLLISTLAVIPATAQKLSNAIARPVSSPIASPIAGPTPHAIAVSAIPGANWVASSATGPAARSSAMMAYDAATRTVVLFGGYSPSALLADTWTWDGAIWTQKAVTGPSARYNGTMAYDAATGTVVLFGGSTGSTYLNDTWTWDGSSWTQQTTPAGLTARIGPQMAYDAATQSIVLFGGYVGGVGNQSDTWTWNGSWTQQTYSTFPGARAYASMAYDAATSSVVLFGGNGSSGTSISDTWIWTSSGWSQQSPASSPSARHGAAMDYDPLTQTVVLFGGANTSPFYGDTWTWNGTNWTAQSPATSPSARQNATLAYNPGTKSLVLFGGVNSSGSGLNDTWNYDAVAFATPSSAVGTATPTPTPVFFTITTAGTLPALSNSNVLTQGAPGLDFTLGTGGTCTGSVSVGTCVVYVNFTPQAPGQRQGAVSLLSSSNSILATALISGTGTGPQATFYPGTQTKILTLTNDAFGITTDANGSLYYWQPDGSISKATPNGSGYTTSVIGTGAGNTGEFAVDGAGNVYYNGSGIIKLTWNPATSTYTSTNIYSGSTLYSVAVDSAGNVYNGASSNLVKLTPSSSGTYTASTIATGFQAINGMAVDLYGNLFVCDSSAGALYKLTPASGAYTQQTISTNVSNCNSVVVDAGGTLYVTADNVSNYILRFAPSGSTYTQLPSIGFTNFSRLNGVALDGSGNLYATDDGNGNYIYKIAVNQPIPMTFPITPVNTTSASQTLSVNNVGNANLTFPIPGSGQNPSLSNFFTMGNTTTCITLTNASSNSVSLAAGAGCMYVVSYSPTINGAVTGNLIFTDNNLNTTNATQTVVMTGTTTSNLNVSVVGQTIPQGTSSILLEFIVGYGGNTAPTATPTLTVNGSATNVGAVTCTTKLGHNNCTATYNPSSLAPGQYTITATQPADSTYGTATSASAYLTITRTSSGPVKLGPIATATPVAATSLSTSSSRR